MLVIDGVKYFTEEEMTAIMKDQLMVICQKWVDEEVTKLNQKYDQMVRESQARKLQTDRWQAKAEKKLALMLRNAERVKFLETCLRGLGITPFGNDDVMH